MVDKILTHSLQGWVPTAFALAQTIFLLFCGEILQFFPAKLVLVWSVTIFETGSLICGVAQNVNQLVVGRTVSSIGAAGMCTSFSWAIFFALQRKSNICIRDTNRRVSYSPWGSPRLFGMFGAVFGLSSIIGPLIGGTFTDYGSLSFIHLFLPC